MAWKENELNMVDTPGHADFGGEVRLIGFQRCCLIGLSNCTVEHFKRNKQRQLLML